MRDGRVRGSGTRGGNYRTARPADAGVEERKRANAAKTRIAAFKVAVVVDGTDSATAPAGV